MSTLEKSEEKVDRFLKENYYFIVGSKTTVQELIGEFAGWQQNTYGNVENEEDIILYLPESFPITLHKDKSESIVHNLWKIDEEIKSWIAAEIANFREMSAKRLESDVERLTEYCYRLKQLEKEPCNNHKTGPCNRCISLETIRINIANLKREY